LQLKDGESVKKAPETTNFVDIPTYVMPGAMPLTDASLVYVKAALVEDTSSELLVTKMLTVVDRSPCALPTAIFAYDGVEHVSSSGLTTMAATWMFPGSKTHAAASDANDVPRSVTTVPPRFGPLLGSIDETVTGA
jgi:hypothetical protein